MVPIFLHSRRFTPTHRGACAHVRGSTELPGGPREPARRRAARGAHRAWEMDREALASGGSATHRTGRRRGGQGDDFRTLFRAGGESSR